MLSLSEEIQFRNPARARAALVSIEAFPPIATRAISAQLSALPNPDDAVHFLNRLISENPAAAHEIAGDPAALRFALTTFSYSRFLSEAVIRRPRMILDLATTGDIHHGYLAEDYENLLVRALPPDAVPQAAELAAFRRTQLLRIMLRDVLRIADLPETIEDLSNLADAILNVTWGAIRRDISRERGAKEAELSVIALGKLGGRELNYSSDVDLIFVYAGEETASPEFPITTREYFKIAANRMTELLSAYTPEGVCYRVDLRLRPDGRYGEVCQPLEGAKRYYASRGRDWELQMLIKARVAAGDSRPGAELLDFVEPLIYRTSTDFRAIEAVSEARARIHEKQRRGGQTGIDVKLASGGIRDIEFLVQCLQRLHGAASTWVRHGGTLLALSRLRDKELLSASEYSRLASAYQFLRHLEHRLQFDEDRQTHILPRDNSQLDLLARKMPPGFPGFAGAAATLMREIDRHFTNVRELYARVIHSRLPGDDASAAAARDRNNDVSAAESTRGGTPQNPARQPGFPSSNLRRYLEQRAPAFSRLISTIGISRNRQSFESLLEKALANPEWLAALEDNPEAARCTIDLFEHSRYFADQLVRYPELIEQVRIACGERQGRTGFHAPRDAEGLRRFFREQMVRIQSDSVYHRVPVFRTLKRTSELAESVIQAAYELAIRESAALAPPLDPAYEPKNQMMIVALGRLGMLEFDLASDADLVFVIPDADAPECVFWAGVAERIINVLGAYTGGGVVFTIDPRLRPDGREGALVQTESACRNYFAGRAEAWEGIAWMKARGVAGDIDRATAFLGEIQEIDWRLHGQSRGSQTELARMRARLEREQGPRNPLKAGPGGYYDIDFALMYLRLKSAGMFFKVLNTPKRIDIIEKMGHLDRADAEFLCHAATFYRAVDHGMRVSTGHADETLPGNRSQLALLTELVHRWTPASLHEGDLESVLKRIRFETRSFFERLFGTSQ